MTSIEFTAKALQLVQSEYDTEVNAQIVWFSYVLGNMKAMVAVLGHPCYYEVTCNNAIQQIYVDKYIKQSNKCHDLD